MLAGHKRNVQIFSDFPKGREELFIIQIQRKVVYLVELVSDRLRRIQSLANQQT